MIQKGGTMENSNFKMLTSNEIMEINGGIALTTAMLVTLFCAGFAGGIAVGILVGLVIGLIKYKKMRPKE